MSKTVTTFEARLASSSRSPDRVMFHFEPVRSTFTFCAPRPNVKPSCESFWNCEVNWGSRKRPRSKNTRVRAPISWSFATSDTRRPLVTKLVEMYANDSVGFSWSFRSSRTSWYSTSSSPPK